MGEGGAVADPAAAADGAAASGDATAAGPVPELGEGGDTAPLAKPKKKR